VAGIDTRFRLRHLNNMNGDYRKALQNYIDDAVATFSAYKSLAERALTQITDEEFYLKADEESNSAALIVKHIAGNQRSRWRDFLTSDGEKPDRDRDSEFENGDDDRRTLMEAWESGWSILFGTLEEIGPDELLQTVLIRGQSHTVIEAINRQLTHYAYHIGQIAYISKAFRKERWETLSVPRNRSAEFTRFIESRAADESERTHPLEGPADFASETSESDIE